MAHRTPQFEPSDSLTTEEIVFLQNLADEADYNSANVAVIQLPTSGTVDGTTVDFVFATKPNIIVSDGVLYRENKGWSWNSGTNTVTMVSAPSYDLYGL